MKRFSLFAATCFMSALVYAQNQLHYHADGSPCLYDHAVKVQSENNPYYKQAVMETFRQAQILGQQQAHLRSSIEIPVVIHMVYKDNSTYVDRTKILEQIAILNEDYQRLNADTSDLRSIFSGIAANPNISFRLDTIIYKQSNTQFYSSGLLPDINVVNKVKFDCEGGDEAWDVKKYLNIWICNLGSAGILGFAYPPADLSHWPAGSTAPTLGQEGVVLDYRIIGRSGSYSMQGINITTQGRTATHEVGHYLGLRHIWGDGTLAIFGAPDCTVDDGVADTPNQGLNANFTCNKNRNTCGSTEPNDLPDMIENFMDYASESCMNTFTQGQVNILRGVLAPNAYRYSLTQNTNYTAPPSNDKIQGATIVQISNDSCNNIVQGSNQYAHPSYKIGQCHGDDYMHGDVWFSFIAPSTAVELTLLASQAIEGTENNIVFELINSNCPSSAGNCTSTFPYNFEHLQQGNTYYLRAYSATPNDRQNFSFCLKSTGIVHVQELQNIQWNIFPNPNNGTFTIALPENLEGQAQLRIINTLGQVILQYNMQEGEKDLQLFLQNQTAGVYTVQLMTRAGFATRKIQLIP